MQTEQTAEAVRVRRSRPRTREGAAGPWLSCSTIPVADGHKSKARRSGESGRVGLGRGCNLSQVVSNGQIGASEPCGVFQRSHNVRRGESGHRSGCASLPFSRKVEEAHTPYEASVTLETGGVLIKIT